MRHDLKSKVVITLIALIMFPLGVFAQKVEIKGTVKDESGEVVAGASVFEKGTTNGAITNNDGGFVFSVKPNATLVVSFIGYNTLEIPVGDKTQLDLVLKTDAMMLGETVVIGYGTMKKSDMTGAISSVDMGEMVKRTTVNPAEALQGKVSGVNIQKTGGNAGSKVLVKIRGVKTFGDNQPLYIIDGFPGDIESVNPQDIASMEVLKDGAAAAIYGSVAANGVIIVTTKNGKKGEVKVDFSSFLSFTNISKKLELLNANEYRQVHKQMYDNYNMYASPKALPAYISKESSVDTDWQDEMLRSGLSESYMMSVRGGGDNAQYSISYNRANDKGIFLGNDFRQDNARAKLLVKKSIFDFDANLAFRFSDNQQPQYQLKEMYMISPLVPVYDENAPSGFGLTNFDGLPNNRNVMADQNFRKATDKKYNTVGNIGITANFTKWLSFKTSYNYRGEHQRQTYHTPPYTADIRSVQEYTYHSESTAYWEEQVWDNILNFTRDFGKHSINAMAGSSVMSNKYTWNSVGVEGKTTIYKVENGKLVTSESAAGFLDPDFSTINAGTGGTFEGSGSKWDYNRASFFGRFNYNYDNRYLLQATIRYDGSSKFGKDSRWGSFPSLAAGWRISQEEFFPKNSIVSNLKLRASWGRLGNENALGYYDFLAQIKTYNTKYQGYVRGDGENAWAGSIARDLENRSLQWETTDTKNIGIDFGLAKNKLTGALNYYYNKTEDLLIIKALPPSAGFNDPILNVGKIKNSGIELEINWNGRIGEELNYNLGLNMSTTNNKVLELSDSDQVLYGTGIKFGTEHFPTQTRIGKPIGSFYLYKTNGIFQNEAEVKSYANKQGELLQPNAKPGDIRFVDVDGDGVIDDKDKVYSGSGIPKFEANMNFSMDYKGFDFSMLVGSAWGHKLYNANKYYFEGMNSGSNFLKSTLNAWTPQNTNTSVPRAVLDDPNGNLKESDRFLENGNFVRLRQVQLGYTLPKKIMEKIKIDKLRFYVSGENLLTITNYSGIDPEFSRTSVLNTGVDNIIFPFTKSVTVGVQFTF